MPTLVKNNACIYDIAIVCRGNGAIRQAHTVKCLKVPLHISGPTIIILLIPWLPRSLSFRPRVVEHIGIFTALHFSLNFHWLSHILIETNNNYAKFGGESACFIYMKTAYKAHGKPTKPNLNGIFMLICGLALVVHYNHLISASMPANDRTWLNLFFHKYIICINYRNLF